ncbi:UDP-glucuronosyltransferase 1-1, variant 2 [Homalodisca vitripennis]|nr:UDP-glucuronosyltransferase 1-1, variant 2 [Homalodisca vitripennis]
MEAFIRPMGFQLLTKGLSEELLSLPQVEKLLASNEKFDVIIIETFFGQEALIGFGHRFKAPVVTLSSFGTFSLVDSIMGNPNPLSYFTTYQLAFTSELTFYQRLKNVIATMSEHHYSYFHHLPNQEAVMIKHFQKYKQSPLPPLLDLLSEIGVVLLNTQPEVSYARAWLPNMVSVGGLHIPKMKTSHPKSGFDSLWNVYSRLCQRCVHHCLQSNTSESNLENRHYSSRSSSQRNGCGMGSTA